jgi:arylsulfatase A-like enzyme
MRSFNARTVAVILAASLLASLSCQKSPHLNLVIITIDTLRADHLSAYGYGSPTSPRMDRFAADGVLFETVACQSSQTLPSHTSIFVGTNPRTHKVISHESQVDPGLTTLAEILKQRGYRTGAFISSHALDSKFGLDQGFDTYWEIQKQLTYRERDLAQAREQDPTTDEALSWLRDSRDAKFFLWIHWFHPHRPYEPPPSYAANFAGSYTGTATSDPEFMMTVWKEHIDLPEEDVRHLRGLYDGEVAFADAQVGRVLDALADEGLLDNTVVVVTSDHGEILYEHEYYFGHDIALYDECLMVPLILYAPGLRIARPRVGRLVQSIDILPTVLDLLEIPHPDGLEGQSLLPLVEGTGTYTNAYCLSETFPFPEKCPPRHAVRSEKAKLIWKETRSGDVDKEYYNLEADPRETVNLYPALPAGAAVLDSVLTSLTSDGGLHPAPIPTAEETGRWRILKSLGYVD